ncbi:MAG: HlyD family efflux transporter periplasmic adaptor subunit [Thioclava marina]|uniref:HlyD family secretion protein n=1 Tax=Thioclava marina TaxID=1915077 RepID=A0ABX3MK92_9RHOB|nr:MULTISPECIES: HlyD family efflux transporter periplasmic adaptor subunit [Thioclava]TNE94677.1 MAG: HlyD family efflux transporter periplasmic adaptor subunit [Paracoccaceae bacterium]MBC7145933.1 HlyD family efflux transporter periplasmic adaptor subunit [Thioclava marina]OOY11906.1 HlyD family secretion protein [Thioclava marina]OOY26797.1 HlyD family secretion protein [Thioclava sp. L04-15]TNF16421.1 MAG: HlyD family efflux transporter periplasmic adaptor subunit [Paracoccaceae bacterium
MKTFRPVIGVVLVAGALWVIIGEQMSGVSADAVVNAPVVTVRSSTAGNLQLPRRPLGAHVNKGELLASVDDTLADTTRLNDLKMEKTIAQANVDQIRGDLNARRAQRQTYVERTAIFRQQRIAEIETKLEFAQARLDRAETGDTKPDAGTSKATKASAASTEPLAQLREDVALLKISLEAAKKGVFLGDGYNDAPNSEQRGLELDGEITSLEVALAHAQSRLRALTDRSARELTRVNTLSTNSIMSPVNGLYWENLQADGVAIQRGDSILKLVDCDVSIVTASVSEGIYNRLHVGDAATFKLASNGSTYAATIARLAGSGAASIYQNLAIAPSQKHLERYDVTLLVPGLKSDPEVDCAVGRTGRVFFEKRPLDFSR